MINEEDRKKIRAFEKIKNKGLYANGNEVQEVYNRIMNVDLRPTNCGSCLRLRIQQLIDKLNLVERQEAKKMEEPKNDENKPIKKAGRPKKS